ncbi:MAG: Protein S19 forms a complex with S13 that binds strongly to the 16S ribosomal RNA, partial [Paramarteilia canceri]
NELSKNLTSRARRKINRGLSPTEKLLKAKCEKKQLSKAKGHKVLPIKTHCRSMPILPCMVGLTLAPYNGLFYDPFEVKLDHVGMKLGEFSFTYKFVTHKRMGKGATSGSKHVALK